MATHQHQNEASGRLPWHIPIPKDQARVAANFPTTVQHMCSHLRHVPASPGSAYQASGTPVSFHSNRSRPGSIMPWTAPPYHSGSKMCMRLKLPTTTRHSPSTVLRQPAVKSSLTTFHSHPWPSGYSSWKQLSTTASEFAASAPPPCLTATGTTASRTALPRVPLRRRHSQPGRNTLPTRTSA